jgi:MPBQ/MSBQ methyltransferase
MRRRHTGPIKVSSALRFYHEVLGLDHLQYGLWEDEPRTLEGLKSAQARYTEYLHSWIPEGVRTILDVGCGTGAAASLLKGRGFEVEGLSPDPYQESLFASRVRSRFHLSRFQDFEPARDYDLALMSESAQYIELERLFPAVRRVAPGGYLLVSDYFVVDEKGGPLAKSGHPLEAFLREANIHGVAIEREDDITERVTPTLDIARDLLENRLHPALEIFGDSLQARRPYVHRIVRWLARKKLAELRDLDRMVDAAEFGRAKRYKIFLFRVPSTKP